MPSKLEQDSFSLHGASGEPARPVSPETRWIGFGEDLRCHVCGHPIHRAEADVEVESGLPPGREPLAFHRRCYGVWMGSPDVDRTAGEPRQSVRKSHA
jgi:rubredoxin